MGGGQVPLPNPIAASEIAAVAPSFGVDPVFFLRVTSRADELYISEAGRRAERTLKARSKKPRK